MENERLIEELKKRAEFWRTTEEDPHEIRTAVYVALSEVVEFLESGNTHRT